MFQIESGFVPVQYYTQSDPYYYTVDNRPLQDLAANDSVLASGVDMNRAMLTAGLTITPTASGTYALTPEQLLNRVLTVTGAATGVTLELPLAIQSWIVVNDLTDALTVTMTGVTGTVSIPTASFLEVFSNGSIFNSL